MESKQFDKLLNNVRKRKNAEPSEVAYAYLETVDNWIKETDLGLEAFIPLIRRVGELRSLLNEPPELSLVGAFKAGKSSVLNAMIGDEIAPVDALPTTAKSTFFRFGPDVRVRIKEGGKWRDSDIFTFRRLVHNTGLTPDEKKALEKIESVAVEHPSNALHDVILVDTPGFHSGDREDDQSALDQLQQTVAFVWVVDVERGLQAPDLKVLSRLPRSGRRYALLNKADLKTPTERKKLLDDFQKRFGEHFNRVFLFSAVACKSGKAGEDMSSDELALLTLDWDREVLGEVRGDAESIQARTAVRDSVPQLRGCSEECAAQIEYLGRLRENVDAAVANLNGMAEAECNAAGSRLTMRYQELVKAMFKKNARVFANAVDVDEGWIFDDYSLDDRRITSLVNAMWQNAVEIEEKLDGVVDESFAKFRKDAEKVLDLCFDIVENLVSEPKGLKESLSSLAHGIIGTSWDFLVDTTQARIGGLTSAYLRGSIFSALVTMRRFASEEVLKNEFRNKCFWSIERLLDILVDDEQVLSEIQELAFGDMNRTKLIGVREGEARSYLEGYFRYIPDLLVAFATGYIDEAVKEYEKSIVQIGQLVELGDTTLNGTN